MKAADLFEDESGLDAYHISPLIEFLAIILHIVTTSHVIIPRT